MVADVFIQILLILLRVVQETKRDVRYWIHDIMMMSLFLCYGRQDNEVLVTEE